MAFTKTVTISINVDIYNIGDDTDPDYPSLRKSIVDAINAGGKWSDTNGSIAKYISYFDIDFVSEGDSIAM
jgi:hypothetical protein